MAVDSIFKFFSLSRSFFYSSKHLFGEKSPFYSYQREITHTLELVEKKKKKKKQKEWCATGVYLPAGSRLLAARV